MYVGKHEQTACSLTSLHCELGPQGEGTHGFVLGRGVTGISLQEKNGSPVKPAGQVQSGT